MVTFLIRTVYTQLMDKSSNWDVGSKLPYDPQVTQGTRSRLLDASLTEQVVAARGLHSILKDVQANRT